MKLIKIEKVGRKEVYDIAVKDVHEYTLSNGVISHNSGVVYSSNEVFIVGKRQIKDGTDIVGWQFILNVEKSRTVRERAAIPFEVTYDGGLDRYSGLLDIAKVTGHVETPKMGWYTRKNVEGDKNWRKKDTSTEEFWAPVLADESFTSAVTDLYGFKGEALFSDKVSQLMNSDIDQETGEVLQPDS